MYQRGREKQEERTERFGRADKLKSFCCTRTRQMIVKCTRVRIARFSSFWCQHCFIPQIKYQNKDGWWVNESLKPRAVVRTTGDETTERNEPFKSSFFLRWVSEKQSQRTHSPWNVTYHKDEVSPGEKKHPPLKLKIAKVRRLAPFNDKRIIILTALLSMLLRYLWDIKQR